MPPLFLIKSNQIKKMENSNNPDLGTDANAKPEHHMARKARLKREEEARLAASGNNGTATPTFTPARVVTASKKKVHRIHTAFEDEYKHYVLTRVSRGNSLRDKRQKAFPPFFYIAGMDSVINPNTKKTDTIRHIEGETSIWRSEQSNIGDNSKVTPILFTDGCCSVHKSRTMTIEYLDHCNANAGNPNRYPSVEARFQEFDSTKRSTEVYDRDIQMSRALLYFDEKCQSDEGIETLMAYAQTLMLPMNRLWSEIKADLAQSLKNNPQQFLEGLDNPKMKKKYIIMEALKNRVLVENPETGTISWNNGAVICTPAIGKNGVDYFVEICSTEKGKDTFDLIKHETEKFILERA